MCFYVWVFGGNGGIIVVAVAVVVVAAVFVSSVVVGESSNSDSKISLCARLCSRNPCPLPCLQP